MTKMRLDLSLGNVAVTRFTVAANTLIHTSVQSLFPLITKGEDFTVIVETSSRSGQGLDDWLALLRGRHEGVADVPGRARTC